VNHVEWIGNTFTIKHQGKILNNNNNNLELSIDHTVVLQRMKPPHFIIMNDRVRTATLSLKVCHEKTQMNVVTYKLVGSVIVITNNDGDGHAIAGLSCDGKYYIFDSNNLLTYDDWHKGKFDNYYKEKKGYSFKYFGVQLFARDDNTA
jgi:hypothetical protein